MIEVSVATGDLIAGRRSALSVRFTNTGRGPCSDVVFHLKFSAGIVLRGGADRVDVPMIPAGHTHVHEIVVEAGRPGRFDLTSRNFSYRDEHDTPIRIRDFRVELTVAEPRPAERIRQPDGRLGIEWERTELDLGEWDVLPVVVSNDTGVPLDDVTVAVAGPSLNAGRQFRVPVLGPGAKAKCPFSVHATEGGRHVPFTVRTEYQYRDLGGMPRKRAQEDHRTIVVRQPSPHVAAAPTPAVQTVLYLSSSPKDLDQLRSDVEMREVMALLKRSRLRDEYRIEWCAAARFGDISQALLDYEPQVVHFSGHGDTDGNLCFEDDNGSTTLRTPQGLARLFGQHRSTIRCVMLNACYSIRLATALQAQIPHVIGMRTRIGDRAAIEFSVGFYTGLFAGSTVPLAYDRGLAHIESDTRIEHEHLTPVIFPPIV